MESNEWTETLEAMVGRRARALRKGRGWSQEDLGRRLELHQTTVAKLESGTRPIRVNELATLAVIFEVPIAELTTETADLDQTNQDLIEAVRAHQYAYQRHAELAVQEKRARERWADAKAEMKSAQELAALALAQAKATQARVTAVKNEAQERFAALRNERQDDGQHQAED